MKKFRRLFVYIKPYWGLAILNAIFNVLGAVFALFSLTMAIPFLGVLFDIQEPVRNKLPLDGATEMLFNSINFELIISTSISFLSGINGKYFIACNVEKILSVLVFLHWFSKFQQLLFCNKSSFICNFFNTGSFQSLTFFNCCNKIGGL